MQYIDLHTHSDASDGTMPPAELIRHAKASGLSAVALTDHDTIAGIAAAQAEADRVGIEFIPGIELSADFTTEMHILGYYIDPAHPALVEEIQNLKEFRAQRNIKMVEKLREQGFDVDVEYILAVTSCESAASMGRVHMAKALVEKGYCKTVKEGFEAYLTGGKPAYCGRQKLSPAECIALIHTSGGLAVLAHPYLLRLEPDALEAKLKELKACGLDGLECWYTEHDEAHTELFVSLAEKYGLAVTGGSDFHAGNKPHIQIGRIYGGKQLPYALLENLKARR